MKTIVDSASYNIYSKMRRTTAMCVISTKCSKRRRQINQLYGKGAASSAGWPSSMEMRRIEDSNERETIGHLCSGKAHLRGSWGICRVGNGDGKRMWGGEKNKKT